MVQLEQSLWLREVLQAKLAHRLQPDLNRQRIDGSQLRRLREQDLVSVSGVADAGGLMDREADVLVLLDDHIADVDAHPDLHGDAIRPGRTTEDELAFRCGQHRVLGCREDREQRVALGSDQPSPEPLEGRREKASVIQEQLAVPDAQIAKQVRRSLDVGEEERQRLDPSAHVGIS
jgi:hypothetical protein